jgi:hypothetical protein
MSHPNIYDQNSKFVLKLPGSLVCHETDAILPAGEATCAIGVVELLPDHDADASGYHEQYEEDAEA